MINVVDNYLEKFKRQRRTHRRLICVLVVLAVIVVLGVYWQLRMTGAALANEVYCGKEEHTHDDSCYEMVLVCGLEESEGTPGHTHTEECYEEQTELICGLEECRAVAGHTHTEECYEEQTELTCGKEESAGHAHTDACYDEEGNLICGQEESAGHTHTADCYTTTKVLVCGKEEREAVAGHTHTEACYQTTKVLICGLEECEATAGHTHTNACYEKKLVCGLEEHTHTVECLIDETADLETASDWEVTVPTAMSGDWADDLVAVAKSQLGYTESTANFTIDDDGETTRGYTRYGAWAGNEYGDWDAMFVFFCLYYADVPQTEFPEATGAYAWSVILKNMGLYGDASNYEVQSGDLAFFDADNDGKIDRVGIVAAVNESSGQLTVIEGDYSENKNDADAVCNVSYGQTDQTIAGYGTVSAAQEAGEESEAERETETGTEAESDLAASEVKSEAEAAETEAIPEETESDLAAAVGENETEAAEDPAEEPALTQQTLEIISGDATITVSGLLPENATITAAPVEVEIEGENVLLAFDISIFYEDADGETVIFEPEDGAVTVTIESSEITDGSSVYYVPEEGEPEKLDTTETEEGLVAFDAEHFSTYAVTSSGSVVASGTIANGEGVEEAITWTIYEDDAGNRTLVIEGDGSIPDYSSENAGQPWYSYRSTVSTLILGEGITRVGKQAFHGNYFTDIQFSSTVTSIGQYAFSYSQKLTSVTIPGTITTVENYAFAYSYHIYDVTLEEGIVTIGDSAFGGNCGSSEDCSNSWITIPASVTSIGEYAFALAAGYIVADGNTYFYADEDGVLYSYDGTTLIDYPKRRVAVSWTIPEKVTTVKKGALQNVKYTSEIYVMHQVSLPTQAFRDSNYTYVYIADDVSIPLTDSLMFYNDPYLTAVHLPENTPLRIYNQYFNSDSQLASLKIPKGTTQIDNLAFSGTTNLETMYYDAAHVTSIHSAIFGTSTMPQFDLTIGTNVDYLVADFSYILEHATSLTIEGPNAFYIEDGAFAKAPAPYTGLSGWIYVTEDGVVYTLDTDTNEATLVYVPDGVTSLTIPAAITDALDGTEEVTFTVTTVAKDALKYAEDLTELTFEDASKITTLENYALANAPITSVTDKAANSGAGSTATTVADATALFTNAEIGYNVFYNTELGGAVAAKNYATDMDGSDSVTVSCMTINVIKGDTTEWIETDDDNTTTVGGYSSLTGDTVQFSISVSNNSGSAQTYRVYVQVSEDDCSLNYTAGETFTVNGVTVTASATDDPYTMCLEFTVEEGQTVNFTVNAIYDTPTSDGGGVTVWGALVETDPLGAVTETETDGEIEAYWTTLRDTYTLAKNNNSQTSVSITADDDGTVRPSAELKWQITLTSEGDLSAYGEDYVTVVTYTDVMTLPAGMEWDADILAAIKAGTVVTRNNVLYEGTTKIAALSLGTTTSLSLSGLSVSYDDATDQVILTWKVRNTGDVNINTNTLNLTVYPEALTVDMTTYDTTAANEITNTADATVKYTYGSPTEQEASVTKTVTGGEGTVKLSKTGTDVTYFGEDLTYTLKVYNDGGLPYKDYQAYTLTDALESNFYISADNMEKMFVEAAADGAELVITIAKASLAATGGSVTDTNGTAGGAYVNTGNSDLDETDGNTLVITYIETTGLYTVTVNGDSASAINGASIESLLQSLGYGVTSAVTYTCVWTLPTTTEDVSRTPTTLFTLTGGGSYTYSIYATVKSTFQKLDDSDWPSEYPKTSALNLNNSATLASADNKTKKTVKADTDSVVREAVIGKSASLDGKDLGSAPEASDGDVLDYTLTFTHYGDGSYDDLPMVDDLYGSQYLLVPYTQNSSNGSIAAAGVTSGTWSGTGVKTYDSDGDGEPDYYVLGVGTYTDVVVGQDADGNWMTAASITVTSGEDQSVELDGATNTWSGVHSQIKWYFDELDGGNYTIQISYKALVDITGYEASYTIGNVVWMNDRTGSRIYAGLWGGGTIIGYDKDIVVDQGSDGDEDNDGLDDDKYTSVKEGETVTYRLTLESTGDAGTFVLTGANIADQLPNTYGVFAWTTDNVKITKIEVDDSAGGSVTNAESLSNSSNWSISESYNGISGTGTYFIVWDDDVSVYFSQNVSVYIYVELTYPTNSERTTDADGNDVGVWNQYADEAQGTTLNNTFYVYRNPANVTHVLAREGEVTLQKGVYALARSTSSMGIGTSSGGTYYATGTDRNYYNNQDSSYRYAVYYVSIYNGASTRLYLNDLYDQLPEGFVYTTLLPSGFNYSFGSHLASIHTITTLSSSSNLNTWLVQTDSDTTYMSAGVSASVNCDGTLVFTFSSGSGDYALKYDEDLGQYYLDKGEAIVFGYICEIGLTADTEDEATNTIAMSYTDYADAGVTESDKSFEARNYEPYGSSDNDGDCTIETSDTVQTEYGFDDGEGNSSWLVSGVTLERGGIKPGIDKETVSYQSSTTSTVYAYENSVTATDLINWEVTLVNGGTMSIVDYVVTDIMPNPYVFTGPVAFTAYDSTGSSQISGTLFTINTSPDTISNLSALNETTLPSLSVTPSNSSTATEVKTDGTVYSMTASLTNTTATFTLCFYFDDDNNLVMEIGMKDAKLDVPEGGKLEITYTSWNPTTTQASTTYINQVTLTPSQSFTSSDIQSGSAVAGAYGTVLGARTVSPVTVAAGYSSNSWKSVTESDQGGNTGNTAVSTGSDNTIALSAPDSVFTYTLNVENVNDVAITKLVLIDNLPYEGDTYAFNDELERDSEYTVVLASSDFEVVITNADNTTETLTAGTDYKVEYSSKTENFSGDDRSGTASSDWQELTSSTNLSEVKSIRVIITKEIPAKATVAVSFDAKVSDPDNVDPGSIAWNNFGYRYQVNNSNIELEAMPLVVGVKVPSAPELTKKLVDLDGNAYTADKDTTFTFVIYEGDELTDANNNNGSYTSQSELIAALDALISAGGSDARKYRIVTITVPAGSSASDTLALYGSNGLGTDSNGTTWWSWEEGEKYTIAEFPEGAYTLKEWDSGNSRLSQSNSCTFTYNASTTLSLTCANVSQVWDLTLTKVDANIQDSQTGEYTKPLNGAVFALYTKNETLKMSDDDYSALSNTYSLSESDLPKKTFTTGEGASAVIWYLMDVQITDTDSITGADGTLSFTNLSEDVYYLVEVKAPDGYNLDATPIPVSRGDSTEVSKTVTNAPGYELPSSGGPGTWRFTLIGILLILCGGAGLLRKFGKLGKLAAPGTIMRS